MFTATDYRATAVKYTELLKAANSPAEKREYRRLEQTFLTMAENEEWMAQNRDKTHNPATDELGHGDTMLRRQVA